MRTLDATTLDEVRFPEPQDGPSLVPVIAQDATTGAVLMLAWADRTALETSLATGTMHYWSRSRRTLWQKGETSGHVQRVQRLALDCDGDAVLAIVDQQGPACHTNAPTCWHDEVEKEPVIAGIIGVLAEVLADRKANPKEGSYTNRLLADENLRLKKISEEAGEFVMAAAKGDTEQVVYEGADLLYHLMVALEGQGVGAERLLAELAKRHAR